MRRTNAVLLMAAMLCGIAAAVCALAAQTSGMTFRTFTVEGGRVQGELSGAGPLEWTGGVTVKGSGLTITCDSFRLWPTPDWREAERIEATGSINVEGRYTAADKTVWDITGKGASASYERSSGEGVIRGSVNFRATNPKTGAALSTAADKMIFNFRTRRFRFERGDQPVHMEWQEPAPPAPSAEPSPQPKEAPT